MKCINCSAELPANVIFCPECGSKVNDVCTHCGVNIKPQAKFCHNCGTLVTGRSEEKSVKRNWLSAVGLFMFIPIIALIIVLLFWRNKESEPLQVSNASKDEQNIQSMAAMEQVHKTLERLQSEIEANPEDLVAIDSLAQMFYFVGSYEKAGKYLQMHLEIEPDNRDIKMFLAMTYSNMNRSDEAITLIKEILTNEPTYAFGLYNLGLIYAHIGNKEEALKNWKLLVQHHPNTEIANMAKKQIQNMEHVDQTTQN
ncbi:MAG: zinc-ribbon domain-containing protein [bacterium]